MSFERLFSYDIAAEPCGSDYISFINDACAQSDAVMMVFCVRRNSKMQHSVMKDIRRKLEPWRIKTRHDPQWPVTESHDNSLQFTIDLYEPSKEIREYLYTAQRLYGWNGEGSPEDICFFRNHHCWLATCSHEEFGWIETDAPVAGAIKPYAEPIHKPNVINYIESY